jgi:hypothetical protein
VHQYTFRDIIAETRSVPDSEDSPLAATADSRLEDIKHLLVLPVVRFGSSSEEIALALRVGSNAVGQLIPGREVKKIVSEQDA